MHTDMGVATRAIERNRDTSPLRRVLGAVASAVAPARLGAAYVLAIVVVVFSIAAPDTFPQWATAQQIFASNAVVALASLALIIPLAAGMFDISVPYTMTLTGVMSTYAIVNSGSSVFVGIALAMLVAGAIGLINGFVVVVAKIDALVGTLATGFLIQALVLWRADNQTISGPQLSGTYSDIAQKTWFGGLTLPVLYVIIVAAGVWYVLAQTATGRRIYATSFNRDASRLAGVRTARLRFLCLVSSSVVAGIAGIVLASTLGSGSSTAGNSYLLPAFAAVFLGATQVRPGYFNAVGTVLAVVLLGTLTTGLGLVGAAQWVQQMTTGLVLILSLAVTGFEVRRAGSKWRQNVALRRLFGRKADDEVGDNAKEAT
jgi:ribose transport system permease protein